MMNCNSCIDSHYFRMDLCVNSWWFIKYCVDSWWPICIDSQWIHSNSWWFTIICMICVDLQWIRDHSWWFMRFTLIHNGFMVNHCDSWWFLMIHKICIDFALIRRQHYFVNNRLIIKRVFWCTRENFYNSYEHLRSRCQKKILMFVDQFTNPSQNIDISRALWPIHTNGHRKR